MKFVAFDLETTGLDPVTDRILEFCFIELDDQLNELGRWTKLVNPEREIPESSIAIHGITPEMVKDVAPFSTHAARVQKLVEDAALIAHNVRFDLQFIHNALIQAGQPGLSPDHPTIDTMQVERRVNGHGLAACYERYMGEMFDDAHRSEADTDAMVQVLRKQREVHSEKLPENVEGLLQQNLELHFNPDVKIRTWLDHGHRFYKNGDCDVVFGFGKHRDQLAKDHIDYLLWMRDRDFPADVKRVVESVLGPQYERKAA
jgi:DNA polymerase III subunit epsilon